MFTVANDAIGKAYIRRDADGACIPLDAKNPDYQKALDYFKKAGITPDFSDKPVPVDQATEAAKAARERLIAKFDKLDPDVQDIITALRLR